ncbi:MAG: type II toxin-antitoxin system HicB family antitoxin [Betaproteobacteria bacterium]|nr:type II toxin-antitoxin system HicB family antitoxin [Betaproteobacteria bacterium]
MRITAVIEREGDGYVSFCPELDISSQGGNVAEARDNLHEAVELFLECADPAEVAQRLHGEVYITQSGIAKSEFEV